MTGRLSSGGKPLLDPQRRVEVVPVKCPAHSGAFGWQGLRVEDYRDLPPSDISCARMNAHLPVYHYTTQIIPADRIFPRRGSDAPPARLFQMSINVIVFVLRDCGAAL